MNMKMSSVLITGFIILASPGVSRAFIDMGIYGGYVPAGSYHRETGTRFNHDLEGTQFGGYAHITVGPTPHVFLFGFGIWYHGSVFTADGPSGNIDIVKHSWGPGVELQLGLPIRDLAFLIRGGMSLKDSYRIENDGPRMTANNMMSTGMFSAGFAYRVMGPAWVVLEYQYVSSYYSRNTVTLIESHGMNLGVKFSI